MKNGLYIVASPIGNINDISPRAVQVLKEADVIACEDSRVTKKLFNLLGISCAREFIIYQNYNEEEQSPRLLALLAEGKSVALISDAGSPLISDPGYKIVRKCREQGIYVTSVPGCCAVITALQLSGLPTNRFMFAGFVPNKEKARVDFLQDLKDIKTTLVIYETAPRLLKTLSAIKNIYHFREVAVARELTKMYEECQRGTAEELITHYTENTPKGEIVIMIAPPEEDETNIDIEGLLKQKMAKMPLKSAVKDLVSEYNLSKNEVYELALRIKNEQ
ncbi:MAG: 16S rRNA (cytidine(1402)-2'-O)-methyltransferase [Alphaproteobacteria bacterium]|nr:16S rRNA (cytidine(1402)-2'-O)-methyltransferase [Alphaproteobacteria bacterium]